MIEFLEQAFSTWYIFGIIFVICCVWIFVGKSLDTSLEDDYPNMGNDCNCKPENGVYDDRLGHGLRCIECGEKIEDE